jgi:hypothetical protein
MSRSASDSIGCALLLYRTVWCCSDEFRWWVGPATIAKVREPASLAVDPGRFASHSNHISLWVIIGAGGALCRKQESPERVFLVLLDSVLSTVAHNKIGRAHV